MISAYNPVLNDGNVVHKEDNVKKHAIFLILAIAILFTASAYAGVVADMTTTVKGLGVNMSMTGKQYTKGDMMRTETTMTSDMPLNPMMGSDMTEESISITRLDKGVEWEINHDAETYSEYKLASEEPEDVGEADPENEFVDAQEFNWEVSVESMDKAEKVSGYDCKGIRGKITGTHKEDQSRKIVLTFDYWHSKDMPGFGEMRSYIEKYQQVAGSGMFDIGADEGFIEGIGEHTQKITQKLNEADGVPVKMIFEITGSFNPVQGQMDQAMGDMDLSQMPEEYRAMYEQMMQKMQPEKTADGMFMLMNSTTIIDNFDTESISDSQFDIPDGFEKEDYGY